MKFKLPKALLVAVLASAAVYAEEIAENPKGSSPNIVTTGNTLVVDTDVDLDDDSKSILTQDKIDGAGNKRAYAIVKDGAGTLKINDRGEYTVNNVLVVREGTLEISNGSHVQNYINYSANTSNLTVGGKDAKLVLDGGSYTQYSSYAGQSVSAIALGSVDGAAVVELKNHSTLHGDHYIVIGDQGGLGYSNAVYGPIGYVTYTTTDGTWDKRYEDGNPTVTVEDAAGNEVTTTTYIKLDDGSTMSAGTSLQISDAVIDICGGSKLSDATKAGLSNKNGEPESYFSYDTADVTNTKTIINVYDGELDCNWNLETGRTEGSETRVTVNGENAKFSVAGVANFGGPNEKGNSNDIGRYDESKTSQTSIILTNGGTAKFRKVIMGDFRDATITVDADSQILKHDESFAGTECGIEVWKKGVIENSGFIKLDIELHGGTYIGDGDDDQFGGSVFTILDGSVVEGLTMTTGTVNISGEVTLTNVTFGTEAVAESVTMYSLRTLSGESDALTLNISDGAIINADELVINDNTTINMVLSEDNTDNTGSITLTGTDANKVSALQKQLEESMKTVNSTGETVTGVTVSIATNVVPEPTTATLSLLALMGLAARRRRK